MSPALVDVETEEGLVQNSHQRRRPEDGFEMKMADSLLQEQLARLRGSWRNESHHQSRAANEASAAGVTGGSTAVASLIGVEVDRKLAGQEEARATDSKHRREQLLREHHSYQQHLRELAQGSSHQPRYCSPPALPPGPSFSTPAPLMRAYQLQLTGAYQSSPPKRPAPPSPYQAPGESLGKRPCLGNPIGNPNTGGNSWPCRELLVELGLKLGRRQAGSQLEQRNAEIEQRNAERQLDQMWHAGALAVGESFKQLVRTPVGKLVLLGAPRTVSMMPPTAPGGSTLKERFVRHVMCHYTPLRPDELQKSLWVSCGHLINLLQPHAPTEVLQLGPHKLAQLIIEWYKDHPAYAGLPYIYWCKNLRDKSNGPLAAHRSTCIHFPFHSLRCLNLPAVSEVGAPPSLTLQEKFHMHVMCNYTPKHPSELPKLDWVSCN